MVIDKTGSLAGIKRHDFCPFGEELSAGIGIRSASLGYGDDLIRQKFTSKERDSETGLDYFLARYHSSVQGRFTSVDPENAGADPELPQTWNGYSYAINNPLTYSDPDGLKVKICDTNGNCTEISDDDANKYFFNKNYQKQAGYSVDHGKVYDSDKNLIGTYQNMCCDSLPDWNAGVINYTREVLRDPRVWVGAAVGVTVGAVLGSRGGNTSSAAVRPNLSPIDRLSRAAAAPDRGGLTKAGRSLTKHGAGARPGNSKFPAATGNPQQINQMAQDMVNDILTNPGTTVTNSYRGRFGNTIEYTAPDGRGLVFKASGEFLFFKE
jgi:RHS repeat-associated protein